MVFVDTSAWFAFFVPTDPDHRRIRDWIGGQHEPVLTTDYCIDETLTLLVARGELVRALEAGGELFERGIARIHFLTPD
ncbi:MAG: PIN domain-containing protein [Planctomycetes bacterium]|nr:PIN domain-containing protein [Planctomycetota bacterium]